MLHCPLYRASVPVDISWLYEDSYHDYVPVDVNQTNKAMSDNGIQFVLVVVSCSCSCSSCSCSCSSSSFSAPPLPPFPLPFSCSFLHRLQVQDRIYSNVCWTIPSTCSCPRIFFLGLHNFSPLVNHNIFNIFLPLAVHSSVRPTTLVSRLCLLRVCPTQTFFLLHPIAFNRFFFFSTHSNSSMLHTLSDHFCLPGLFMSAFQMPPV